MSAKWTMRRNWNMNVMDLKGNLFWGFHISFIEMFRDEYVITDLQIKWWYDIQDNRKMN